MTSPVKLGFSPVATQILQGFLLPKIICFESVNILSRDSIAQMAMSLLVTALQSSRAGEQGSGVCRAARRWSPHPGHQGWSQALPGPGEQGPAAGSGGEEALGVRPYTRGLAEGLVPPPHLLKRPPDTRREPPMCSSSRRPHTADHHVHRVTQM